MNKLEYWFIQGGWVMYPLALCSLITLAVTAERCLFWVQMFWRGRLMTAPSYAALNRLHHQHYLNRLFRQLPTHPAQVEVELAIRSQHILRDMNQGLTLLETIIILAPLLGILGTVTGIMQSFDALSQSDPKLLGQGLSEALITTAAGLLIAIIAQIPLTWSETCTQKAIEIMNRWQWQLSLEDAEKEDKKKLDEDTPLSISPIADNQAFSC